MKIGIDVQALQTEGSKNRGIGRYSENLIKAILKNDPRNSFKLFLNGLYEDKIDITENNRVELKTVKYINPENFSDRDANNLIQFLEYKNSNLDILQIMSSAEGFPSKLPVTNNYIDRLNSIICTIIYDLIPLHYPEHYFSNPNFKHEYFKNLKTLYHSDIIFTISDSTREDVINFLGINPNNVISIKGASSDNFFRLENLSDKQINQIKKKYGIKEQFILYTGGIEFRKNIEKSIMAFSKIDKALLSNVSYVLVCKINPPDKLRLNQLAEECNIKNNLVLTDYIPDEELNILYNSCNAFIFPSLIEGLGIPILEAMKCGAPVIGSNTSGILELINDQTFTFNPNNQNEITDIINKILKDKSFKSNASKNSFKQSKNYSWDISIKKVISAYNHIENSILGKKIHREFKPKIAYFSPLPPKKSGISFYSAELLPLLSKYWDIDIFIDDYTCADPYLTTNFEIFSYKDFEELAEQNHYDNIIYQFGNSDNHIYMFEMLKKHPGVVVLHDVFLSGVIFWMTGRKGKLEEFIDEVIYSHGDKGKKLVEKAKKNIIPWEHLIWNLQINKRVIDNATHVIVHSSWDKQSITNLYPNLNEKISTIHQFSPIREFLRREYVKTELGFSNDDFLVCSFGFVVTTKKIDSIIKNIKKFLDSKPNTKYVIVGELDNQYGEVVKKVIKDQNLSDKVKLTGFVDSSEYTKYLASCDVCISLREKTRAGTSASINHSLGAGIPTIISDVEPFNEFPDEVALKINPSDEKKLSDILEKLYENNDYRNELGKKAKEYAEKNISKDACVEKYVSIIQKTLKSPNLLVPL